MDGSLASIFMDPAPSNSWACGNGESPEELQYKLICASMELESAKAAAKAEGKLQETKLWHLQELLSITKKERDEARDECRKLQECLLQHTTSSADSPCSFIHSSSIVSSPSSSPWSLQDLEEHLNNDHFCCMPKAPVPLELQQALQSFSQSGTEGQDLQALFAIEPTCEGVPEDSQQEFSLEILDQDLSFDADPSLNLTDLQQDDVEGFQDASKAMASIRSLSRQSSSNSSSASVQKFQQVQCTIGPSEVSAPMSTHITAMSPPLAGAAMANSASSPTLSMGNNGTCVMRTLVNNAPSPTVSLGTMATSSPPGNAMPVRAMPTMKAAASTMHTFSAPTMASPAAKSQGNPTPMRQVHLPEPPEADLQVMLSSLPEKGKLLQAVMQAGPLLQTLLLAGPLPQWRHPPPALSTGDIPKVSMVPSNVLLPYPTYMPTSLIQGPVGYYPINNGGPSSTTTRARVVNADPCSRSKKLRKLSPASPHQGQLMHMLPGEGRPSAGVSHSPTIY